MNSITDLINDKADEIFPNQPQATPTSPPQDDNELDLENYDEEVEKVDTEPIQKPETIEPEPETTENNPVSTQENEETTPPPKDTTIDLEKLKSKIYSIKDQLDSVIRLIEGNKVFENKTITKPEKTVEKEDGQVVHGTFDGEKMIGEDNKEYSIPPNYASKSKMVEGDTLKLTIAENGRFIYKQIEPIERVRKVGILTKDPETNQWCIQENDKRYKVLNASVTFYKGNPGDEVVFIVAKDIPNSWGAVDNIVKKTV